MSIHVGKKKFKIALKKYVVKEKYNATVNDFLGSVDENGALLEPENLNLVFNGVKSVGTEVLLRAFQKKENVTSVDFPDIESVGVRGLNFCFMNCKNLTTVLGFNNLTTINNEGLNQCFANCTNLTTAPSFNSLTTINGEGLYYCFNNCTNLTTAPSFNSLTTVGKDGLYYCFQNCTSLTTAPTFNNLTTVGYRGLYYCFRKCTNLTTAPSFNSLNTVDYRGLAGCFSTCTNLTSLSFPALKSDSFGSSTNQFNNMLYGITGCTVHFPGNLQSVIGSWSDVTSGFGGTNTTVLFDLPNTGARP